MSGPVDESAFIRCGFCEQRAQFGIIAISLCKLGQGDQSFACSGVRFTIVEAAARVTACAEAPECAVECFAPKMPCLLQKTLGQERIRHDQWGLDDEVKES